MSEQTALKRNLTPVNIITALVLFAGTLFMVTRPQQTPTTAGEQPLFTLAGKAYHSEDLSGRFRQPLQQVEMEYYNKRKLIAQAAAIELYIEQQAAKSGEPPQQVRQRLFTVAPPSEQQIRQFYDQNRPAIPGEFEQVSDEIGRYLSQIAQNQQRQALIEKLINLKELQLHLTPPQSTQVQIDTTGFPSKGVADAKVVLVEFADYQCPHCRAAHEQLTPLIEPYLDRIRFVYMDFPINRSGISRKVAEGAVCADQQGRFWDYQQQAYDQQPQLGADSARQIAEQLGLQLDAFDRCLNDEATAAKVKRSEQQAIAAGVTGTPTFFLNGEKLQLEQPRQDLPQAIEQALQLF